MRHFLEALPQFAVMRANDAGRREHLIVKFSAIVLGEEIAHDEFCQPEKSKQMQNQANSTDRHRAACAAVAGNVRERWLRQYVAQKLQSDPIFPQAYELLGALRGPILDVGCGLGLLGFYLRELGCDQPLIGLDRDERKVTRAREIAAAGGYSALEFRSEDVRQAVPHFCGNVAVFDLLHYLPRTDQFALLSRLAGCVAPGGTLIIRDAPRDRSVRFWLTLLGELFAQTISWNIGAPLHFPSRGEISAPFSEGEFSRESRPLWGRTPFNNHVFIFRRPAGVAVPALG